MCTAAVATPGCVERKRVFRRGGAALGAGRCNTAAAAAAWLGVARLTASSPLQFTAKLTAAPLLLVPIRTTAPPRRPLPPQLRQQLVGAAQGGVPLLQPLMQRRVLGEEGLAGRWFGGWAVCEALLGAEAVYSA